MDTPLCAFPPPVPPGRNWQRNCGERVGTFGPSGRSGVRPSRGLGVMDSEHEAQDELVEDRRREYRVQPAAAVFPIMSGREFDELVEDVRVNGLREPVVVRGDQLIDRRNRVRACAAAGVVPEVRELERGTDVAWWVMSVNAHRRHLDASQRALLASRLSALSGEVTLSQAGEMMGVSRASAARAATIRPMRLSSRSHSIAGTL